jgi:hypothetical protein
LALKRSFLLNSTNQQYHQYAAFFFSKSFAWSKLRPVRSETLPLTAKYRFANNQLDRLPAMAADLVRRQVALIITGGDASSLNRQVLSRP